MNNYVYKKMKNNIKVISILAIFIVFLSTYNVISIKNEKINIMDEVKIEFINSRFFLWIKPDTGPPLDGYPVIFLFHGASQHAFSWINDYNKWNKNQMSFTKDAIEQGFFIVILESKRPIWPGPRAWDVFNNNLSENLDFQYIQNIIHWFELSDLKVNLKNLYCVGFSSGAFMCSKMALYFENLFNAIALNSGCNADSIILTKRGPIFNITRSYNISKNHPPSLLLHGEKDKLVPVNCSINYFNDLQKAEVETDLIVNKNEGHVWLQMNNHDILNWFNKYLT